MPRLKVADEELNVKDLEDAEYDEDGESYSSYDGEEPPKDTDLLGRVKRIWWTYTTNDDPMLKVLFEAEDNEGNEEEYNGLGIWENLALTQAAKFKWAPFLRVMGLTIRDVKTKTTVKDNEGDKVGLVVTSIGDFEVGGDEAWCRVITGRERFQGEWQTKVAKWLEPDEVTDAQEDAEEEAEEEEPEETPAPRGRGRRTAPAKEEAKPAARGSRRTASAPAKPAARPAPARGRRSSKDDPPF